MFAALRPAPRPFAQQWGQEDAGAEAAEVGKIRDRRGGPHGEQFLHPAELQNEEHEDQHHKKHGRADNLEGDSSDCSLNVAGIEAPS